jgi:aldehyde dehydrogenase (NAD+)
MDHAIEYISERPKPLSAYVFTDKKAVAEHFIRHTSSGSVCVNDTVVQVRIRTLIASVMECSQSRVLKFRS